MMGWGRVGVVRLQGQEGIENIFFKKAAKDLETNFVKCVVLDAMNSILLAEWSEKVFDYLRSA